MTDASHLSRLRRVVRSRAFQLAVAAVFLGVPLLRWLDAVGGPEGVRARFGLLAPAITLPVQAALAVTPFPSDVLCIANGAVYGFWLGAILSWVGWWLAAMAEYGIGRRARRDFDLEAHLARVPAWLRRFPVGHPVFLIACRQIPGVGGHLSTLVPGAAGVPLVRHAWCQAVAIVPGALFTAALGTGLVAL